ncbi:energy-coupling factor transporter transmembrane protein EcfT [Rubrobacter taiwanensis]|uniref:Energy-coupling factor transporter transmembrane protein EcfT n=1 Tax=Rubrobacter taiwanensis TaxID=185139 RepID=A0A4R1BHK1_9ACTN|nr:energy-coupling factor transporter transmembrane component T [Rubrobacter taiwanensis]TCJ16713.1 energy-coupling factor transporter transmembrane protein EcfT [Rubrobacter taiwanensis]
MAYEVAYQDRGTIIHRLDPRVKLLWWLSINVTLATWNDPLFLALLLGSVFAYGRVAGIPFAENARHLLPVLPFVAFVLVANIAFWRPPDPAAANLIGHLFGEGVPVLPAIPVYWETLIFSVGTLLRLLTLVLSALILIKTVSPSELALAVVKMGVPPEIGMALSMTIAYIPVVIGQLTAVMEAQQSRAWNTKVSNPIARFRAYVPIAIPTFFRSFQAAEAMASAMMSRGFGYDVDNRTELNPLRFRRRDWAAAGAFTAALVIGVSLGFAGIAKYTFTAGLLGL